MVYRRNFKPSKGRPSLSAIIDEIHANLSNPELSEEEAEELAVSAKEAHAEQDKKR